MKKQIYFLLFFLNFGFQCFPQKIDKKDVLQNAVVNMYAQILVQPEEKIYLQTDKPYYMNGEKIFFRAFMLHASTLKVADWSRYIYVELISPVDTAVVRQQIRCDENRMFYGALNVPETLPEGTYRLRAYSRYMENSGEEFFFSRPVYIGDPNAAALSIDEKFTPIDENNVKLELSFKDLKTKEVKLPKSLEINQNKGKSSNFTNPRDQTGKYEETFSIKAGTLQRVILIDYKDSKNSFKKYVTIPYFDTFPDVSFYPEGGQLIAGKLSRVAFKALLPGAESANVSGAIFNSKAEQVATFSTSKDGMGAFSFTPINGEKYYAQCDYKGQTTKINLPAIQSSGYALQTNWETDSLDIKLNATATSPVKCYLLIHHQGIPVYLKPWDFSHSEVRVNKKLLVTGVSHVMFLDSAFQTISERLVFNNLHDQITPEVTASKKTLKPREKVDLNVKFDMTPADSIPPTLAIAVTDDKDVKLDSTTNIVSEILLSSELKGSISNPLWYFSDAPNAFASADLLMMTNGWRNYHVSDVLLNDLQKPKIKPEQSQSFSGKIKGRFSRSYKDGNIKIMALGYKFSDVVASGDDGRFEFNNFEFPDSTAYFIMCYNKKGKEDDIMDLKLDPITYPAVKLPFAGNSTYHVEGKDLTDFLTKANRKYLNEKGFRQIDLPEVVVKASKKEAVKRYDNKTMISDDPDAFISSDEIETFPPSSFDQLFMKLPGVLSVSPEGVKIRDRYATFVLDGVPLHCTYEELSSYVSVVEIAQVDLYKDISKTMVFGASGAPVIALTSWPPGIAMQKKLAELTNRTMILPLGYQNPVEFYSPKYDTPELKNSNIPDLRSTIYWKPNLKADKGGNSLVSFYTADPESTYSVVVEGFTNGKKLVYSRMNALVEVKK